MKRQHPLRVRPCVAHRLQRAGRRRRPPDLAVALIGEDAEIVLLRQRQQPGPIAARGDRALRVGGRAQIDHRRAVERFARQGGEVGQVAGLGRGVDIDRLRPRRQRRRRIGLIERIGQQHRRALAALLLRAQRQTGHEQPLARAIQRQDRALGVKAHAKAARQPPRAGGAQLLRPLVGRILAVEMRVGRQRLRHEGGPGVRRLADRHGNRRAAGRMAVEQRAQARKGVVRQVLKPRGVLHRVSPQAGRLARPCPPANIP